MTLRLVRDAEKLLKASGLPYELRTCSRHTAVLLGGRQVMVLAHASHGRDTRMLERIIRKATSR